MGHGAAAVTDAQYELGTLLERCAYADARLRRALAERIADQVVRHAVEKRARHARFRSEFRRQAVHALALVLPADRLPP